MIITTKLRLLTIIVHYSITDVLLTFSLVLKISITPPSYPLILLTASFSHHLFLLSSVSLTTSLAPCLSCPHSPGVRVKQCPFVAMVISGPSVSPNLCLYVYLSVCLSF